MIFFRIIKIENLVTTSVLQFWYSDKEIVQKMIKVDVYSQNMIQNFEKN